jgi:hypothetical protein
MIVPAMITTHLMRHSLLRVQPLARVHQRKQCRLQ